MRRRLQWLDAIKGFGILLIMISHSCGLFSGGRFIAIGYVAIFFVLAGYTAKFQPAIEIIRSKSKRLLLPYFFYGIIMLIISALIINTKIDTGITGLLYSRHHGPSQYCALGVNAPMWFLTAMFLSFVLWSVYANIDRKYRGLFCLLCLLSAGAFTLSPILLPWSIDTSFFFIVCIVIGNISWNKGWTNYNKKRYSSYSALFALYLVLCFLNTGTNLSLGDYGCFGILSIPIVLAIAVLECLILGWIFQILGEKSFVTRIFAIIGRQSLRLMCIHAPIFYIIAHFIKTEIHILAIIQFIIVFIISFILECLFRQFDIKSL